MTISEQPDSRHLAWFIPWPIYQRTSRINKQKSGKCSSWIPKKMFIKKNIHPNLIDNPGYIIFFGPFRHWPTSFVPTSSAKNPPCLGEGKFRSLHLGSDHLSTAGLQPRWVAWRASGDVMGNLRYFQITWTNKDILGGKIPIYPSFGVTSAKVAIICPVSMVHYHAHIPPGKGSMAIASPSLS